MPDQITEIDWKDCIDGSRDGMRCAGCDELISLTDCETVAEAKRKMTEHFDGCSMSSA